jgi:UDP-glucose 4-epimerase
VKFLITGGAGFIGSHLTEKLVEEGHEVVVFDNQTSGLIGNLSSIASKVEFVFGDILEESKLVKLVDGVDEVIHLAAALGVFKIINNPLHSLKINIQGTENVLKLAEKYQKPFLFASSSEVYGKNNKIPLSEEDDRIIGHPLKTRWSYSEAKAVDESLAYFYYLENQLPIKIVRLFNTVGPRQVGDYGMVLPRFVTAALNNKPIQVYGNGDQIRCFCHVSDAVRALFSVIKSDRAIGHVFNIGNNHQISIMGLARKVIEVTCSKSEIIKIPYTEAYPLGFEDMQVRVPDISKIKKVLDWSPEIGLEQIIRDIASFHTKFA